MKLVVDASVALKWFLKLRPDESDIEKAAAVAEAFELHGAELHAPAHWSVEVIAVVCREVPLLTSDALQMLDECRPIVVADSSTLAMAAKLSIELNHHAFDTLYHAVAIRTGATLVTADQRYLGKASGLGHILHLRDFRLRDGT